MNMRATFGRYVRMAVDPLKPVVHLELHTGDLAGASELYAGLCGWTPRPVHTDAGTYWSVGLGGEVGGGMVECSTRRPMWLPYVEVDDVVEATERARALGSRVALEPREGPLGWRSVVVSPVGGELAFWQPK